MLLNKPRGVITTATDTHGRQTVLDLVDPGVRVFPVGRLDRDTTGALVLTNDGQLANALMHPSGGVPKTYVAEVQGNVSEQDIHALEAGVELEDGLTAPATARAVQPTVVELTIHEGRNRQVRRMLDAVGHPVTALHRSSYAGLEVSDLSPGAWLASHRKRWRSCAPPGAGDSPVDRPEFRLFTGLGARGARGRVTVRSPADGSLAPTSLC